MFRLKVWFSNDWHWGRVSYETLEAATKRIAELKAVGIKAKAVPSSELYN